MNTEKTHDLATLLVSYPFKVSFESAVFETQEEFKSRFDKGIPIYVDETYYVHETNTTLVTETNLSYWSKWRDCHYYTLRRNSKNEQIYIMTGGRYD